MFHCDIALFPSSMALFDPLCIRECGGTRFNWASSDFSLRFTHLSFSTLISPPRSFYIYTQLQQKSAIHIIAMEKQTLSSERQEIFFCVSYSCGKHWFAADGDFPQTDRLISPFSLHCPQCIAFFLYSSCCASVTLLFCLYFHCTY